ncbi:MAG: ATP-dependent RecD-like DNA helicase [Acidobacteria bacterium]|nr:MAG: ATP-dependent RecD-like DNA helicase [Acidobacteriota bacterium]
MEGVVERVVYSNEENGWSVVRLSLPQRGEATAVGHLLGVQPGESVRLEGRWVRDPTYGEQFRAESYLTVEPATLAGIERYLASGLIPGIGDKHAAALVRHFGLDALEVIDRQPERLTEVPGIGKVRSRRIREAWGEQRAVRDVMIFLQGHGVSPRLAAKIFKVYGRDAVRVVKENPYRLAQEVYGIGFQTADRIARDVGLPADDPQRLAAGVIYALRRAADDGHTYLPEEELLERAGEVLGVAPQALEPVVAHLAAAGELILRPLPGGGKAVFSTPLERAEASLAENLRRLALSPPPPLRIDVERALAWYQRRAGIDLAAEQRRAIARALSERLLVITGGPGTGKTTLVRGIVAILVKKGLKVALAAPTGRAAKRLAEATGHAARTVHRLLEWNPHDRAFARGPDHPLAADVVVVDEASMLDVQLAASIARAIPERGRLVLVGDVDQLPSVGAGRVLADVIDSGVVPVARLTEIFRQAQQSLIVQNAHRVRAGDMPILRPPGDEGDFFFFRREEPERIVATVLELVTRRLPRRFGFDPQADVQVLTPMQRGLLGAANLNAELQARLNPGGRAVGRGRRQLRLGDRVMQVRNNYDLEVWNGDVGRVAGLDAENETLSVAFDERLVRYDFANLDELVLAYAISIHKSQGSEYPCVVIPLHTQHYVLLERNLLYTAITRGKRLVIVVGSRRALALAVKNATSRQRYTLLAQRLRG